MGKILESVIQTRLQVVAEGENGISVNQYGFRKALSTIDTIMTVVSIIIDAIQVRRWKGGTKKYGFDATLDVKNVFNTANWKLKEIECSQLPAAAPGKLFPTECWSRTARRGPRTATLQHEFRKDRY